MPEATAELFSKRVCIQGTSQPVAGNWEEMTSMQPVALAIMIFGPIAFIAILTARASPQPIQAR